MELSVSLHWTMSTFEEHYKCRNLWTRYTEFPMNSLRSSEFSKLNAKNLPWRERERERHDWFTLVGRRTRSKVYYCQWNINWLGPSINWVKPKSATNNVITPFCHQLCPCVLCTSLIYNFLIKKKTQKKKYGFEGVFKVGTRRFHLKRSC